MSIFGKIMNAIFGAGTANAAPVPEAATAGGSAPSSAPASGSASTAAPAQKVDIAAVLDKAVKAKGQKLNWKTSIVDLMKALDLDSGLKARQQLADELGYKGDKGDSAKMNVWLHKQVIAKLEANGGVVPADLKD